MQESQNLNIAFVKNKTLKDDITLNMKINLCNQ